MPISDRRNMIFACNRPERENKLTIKFQVVSPSPLGFKFQYCNDYYLVGECTNFFIVTDFIIPSFILKPYGLAVLHLAKWSKIPAFTKTLGAESVLAKLLDHAFRYLKGISYLRLNLILYFVHACVWPWIDVGLLVFLGPLEWQQSINNALNFRVIFSRCKKILTV